MWRNYLAAALRNLNRNRAYSIVNLLGLALGFATAIVIALYVRYEYSFERFWPDHERLFIAGETIHTPDKAPLRVTALYPYVAADLKTDFPEIEAVARAEQTQFVLRRGGVNTTVNAAFWVDPDYFTLFPVRAVAGDLASALRRPDGLVVTRATARRLFNRDNVVGEKLELSSSFSDRPSVVEITAVIDDLPDNTHINGEAFASGLASFSQLGQEDTFADRATVTQQNTLTYGRFKPGARLSDVSAALPEFVARHTPTTNSSTDSKTEIELSLMPLDALHFAPRAIGILGTKPPGDERSVESMMMIAVLILVVAASNFVNMMTARSSRRAVEVGVRKTLGGVKRQLMAQFLGEALGFTGLALLVAGAAVAIILRPIDLFLQRDLVRQMTPAFALGVGVVALFTGLLAGIYPAFILSAFRPIAVLKGALFAPSGSGRLRQGLVVAQFAVLVALILITATVLRQTNFAMHQRLRSDTDQIYLAGLGSGCTQDIVRRVSTAPGVRLAGCVAANALGIGNMSTTITLPDGRKDGGYEAMPADEAYFPIFGLAPLAGRLLSPEFGGDDVLRRDPASTATPNVVINETAARRLGYANVAPAVGQHLRWTHPQAHGSGTEPTVSAPGDSEIVGVVPDFVVGSVRDPIQPTLYYIEPSFANALVTSLDGARLPEALKAIQEVYTQTYAGQPYNGAFYDQFMAYVNLDIVKQAAIFAAFAAVAIAIGCLGLFALAVFTAERATKEIGLRKAMGASRMDIVRLFGWRFLRPVLWANLFAWPIAYLFMRHWLDGFAYRVSIGPLVFVAASAAALVIALATVTGHALLVARARPVTALRYE